VSNVIRTVLMMRQ